MRIGLFTDTYLPVVNGVSYVIDGTRRELEKLGHEVYIFAPAPYRRYRERDPQVTRFRAIKGISFEENLTSMFFPRRQLQKLKELDLDVIHFFTPVQVGLLGAYTALSTNTALIGHHCTDYYAYGRYYPSVVPFLVALPLALPIVFRIKTAEWQTLLRSLRQKSPSEAWKQKITAELLTALYNRCDAVVTVSPKMQQQLKSWRTKRPIRLLPSGVDPLPIDSGYQRRFMKQHDIASDDQVVLYVGRLAAEKNVELLIRSFDRVAARIPTAKLLLVGDFEHRDTLEALAKSQQSAQRIIFSGTIAHQRIGAIYDLASVFAFPSLTDTQGLVLHEAANAGLPIVLVDRDISAVVKDGYNGYASANNSRDFAAQITKLLKDDAVRSRMAVNSRRLGSRFSEAKQTRRLLQLYQRVLATKG